MQHFVQDMEVSRGGLSAFDAAAVTRQHPCDVTRDKYYCNAELYRGDALQTNYAIINI